MTRRESVHFNPPIELSDYNLFDIHRNLGRPPRWTFPTILTGHGLRCVRLDFENFDQLWPLLAEGDTTFVDKEYRDRKELYQQVLFLYGSAVYSGKRGACDRIITEVVSAPGKPIVSPNSIRGGYIRNLEGRRIVGVLHLYALSHERLGYGQSNPFVGLQLADEHRGRGIGGRAIRLLECFVQSTYPEVSGLTANSRLANERSLRLFRRLGFAEEGKYAEYEDEVFLVKEVTSFAENSGAERY